MRVVHVVRRRDPRFFSLEAVFGNIRDAWTDGPPPVVWELPRPGVSLWNCVHLWRRARQEPRDTVFHITGDVLYACMALPRRRTTFTVHDCVFMNRLSGLRRWLVLTLTLRLPVLICPRITAISEKTKAELLQLTGCDPSRVVVIPNPVSPRIRHVPRPFPSEAPRVLFMGITPNKNLHRAIEALTGLDVHLTVVGRPEAEQLQRLSDSGIPYDIRHGLTDEEVAILYQASDIILFPSLYEGFGLPVTEGFRAGRPVITSDISPMREVAGDAACLVDPEDVESIRGGVVRICQDADYRYHLVRKGLERARDFEPSAIAGRYAAFCRDILAASR